MEKHATNTSAVLPVQITAKTDPEGASLGANDELHGGAQNSLHLIHEYLVKISHLASGSYDELTKHQLAYLSEHQKLLQSVAACNALAHENEKLQHESQYYKRELLPQYERLIHSQKQEIYEAQIQARTFEVKAAELEKTSSAEIEEHKRTVSATTELLRAQNQKVEELESRVKSLSTFSQASSSKRTRYIEVPELPKRSQRRCKKTMQGVHAV